MAELIVAILSPFLSAALGKLASPEFSDLFRQQKFNHGLIKKLKTKMMAFSLIVNDAEEKQFTNADVRAWLMELKDAAYDAEDVLDEIQIQIEYQAHQSKAVKENQESSSSSQDPLKQELESKLLEILLRLEDLMKDSAVFGLSKAVGEKRSSEKRKTTSLVDKLEGFYGRDADKKAIMDMLRSDDDSGSNPGVIPIVGMGGMGKTTLAKHVYNNKEVKKMFQRRAWVCVSDQFDETKVTKEIVEKVTGTACLYNDLDQLQHKLKEALHGQRFLLVLDDVWCEDDEKSRNLLAPLRSGAKGSKIIITSRSKQVASKVQTVPTYDLSKLKDHDSWDLFASHAFRNVNSTANPKLQAIGKEIVKRCGGLPLALQALGSVLGFQKNADKWKEVVEMEIWDVQNANILPALAVSYNHLPSHLKSCFAHCAIFPQHYKFKKEELVLLWMSGGFLAQQMGNQTLQEVGERCFEDLVSRSFFQHSSTSSGERWFVMHDLVHDLARFVSGEFYSRLEGGTSSMIGGRTRHLSYDGAKNVVRKKFRGNYEAPFLRSFVLAQQSGCRCGQLNEKCIDEEVIVEILRTRKLFRVVSLPCYGIKKLPDSIGELNHMRHLDLSHTFIKLLPKKVTDLFNLEILILRDCIELVELPADMERLVNLCHLDLGGTRLQGMPPHMGKLKKLSKLTDFIVGKSGGSSIKELGQLHYLRGEICIQRLENVSDAGDATEADLKGKEKLKVLKLSWNGDNRDSRQVKEVLEKLQPHIHIELIRIRGYGGTEFPKWLGDSSFSKLEKLYLEGCKSIILPSLGQLPSLEELNIYGGSDVSDAMLETIGPKFYGECKPGEKQFPSLKVIRFEDMLNWREWISCNGAFAVLERLELVNCPKLMFVPGTLPGVKRVVIRDCHELDVETLLSSTSATLETIEIGGSEKVKCISVETFPNLKKLSIQDCSNLESLWSTGTTTTRRTTDPLLQSLEINRCKKLVAGRMQWGLQSLPSLSKFTIGGGSSEDVESSFPEEKLLPSSLTSLKIEGFTKMRSLNYKGLENLTTLQSLEIFNCENLVSLPEENLPSCLSSLHIYGCPFLQKRCEREKGEDWPKIQHIRHVLIG